MNAEPVTVRRRGRRAAAHGAPTKLVRGVGLTLATALLVSACAAGQQAETAKERPTLDGTNADVGNIHLRALVIEPPSGATLYYPSGSDVELKLVLVNSGARPDRLVSISSPAVTDWGAFRTTAQADAVISSSQATPTPSATKRARPARTTVSGSAGATRTRTRTATSTPSATSTATSTPTPTPATSSAAAPLPSPNRSIMIPPGSRVSWGTPEAKGALLLIDVTKDLYPGGTLTLTFGFQDAGSVTVVVPVGLAPEPNGSTIPALPSASIAG